MNIVLDTNVISELDGRKYTAHLLTWLNRFQRDELFLTTVAVAEIRYGLSLLPKGRRREVMTQFYDRMESGFAGRIFSFTLEAAHLYGRLTADRQKIGRTIKTKDAMIAAICLSHGATLATRNTKDFEGLDLKLINPFEGG
jgi:predicted nucleic acid-binding protein